MDREVIAEKLEPLRRCLARIAARRPPTVEALMSDVDAQDIVTLNLTRAVRICTDGVQDLEAFAAAIARRTW